METQTLHTPVPQAAAEGAGRMDLYAGIHKALRLFMSRTLTRVGAADPRDATDVADALGMLERLLALCELHLKDENEFVHPALERARPGSSARIAGEHAHHVESFAVLRDWPAWCGTAPTPRAAALGRLYRAGAVRRRQLPACRWRKTVHNACCGPYTDAELAAIEQAIVASIPPRRWPSAALVLPALSAERAGMLAGMRQGMPPGPLPACSASPKARSLARTSPSCSATCSSRWRRS